MDVLRTVAEVRAWRATHPDVALVPTMGAFHEGHLSLMRQAQQLAPVVAVSLFVNPRQFGPGEDLTRYPRREVQDLALAESVGVQLVYAPSVEEVYRSSVTTLEILGPALGFEGAYRPGHFNGVATIVLKLFNTIQPSHAIFGWKDLQQCAVIRRMVEDLDFPVKLAFLETIREADGLALSSRNVFLTPEERILAPLFANTLRQVAAVNRQTAAETWQDVHDHERQAVLRLRDHGFLPDYVTVVDSRTMLPAQAPHSANRVAGAVRIGSVRLIDNVPIE